MKIFGMFLGTLATATFFAQPTLADDAIVTLDVEYSSTAPDSPGNWQIFARVEDTDSGADGSFGLSAVRALLTEIDFGTDGDAITIAPGIGAITVLNGQTPAQMIDAVTIEIVYGQDLGGSVITNIGNSGDVLIASGTFSAGQDPGFGMDGSLLTAALFLNQGSSPFIGIDPDNTVTVINRRVVPEPASLALLLVGGLAMASRRSRN